MAALLVLAPAQAQQQPQQAVMEEWLVQASGAESTSGMEPLEGSRVHFISTRKATADSFTVRWYRISAERYRGKRLRLTARLKPRDPGVDLRLLMAVLAPGNGAQVRQAVDLAVGKWTSGSIVLDVPANAGTIVFGAIGAGTGEVWMEPVAFETVGRNVPVDKMPTEAGLPTVPTL